jgi:hypothetical protein
MPSVGSRASWAAMHSDPAGLTAEQMDNLALAFCAQADVLKRKRKKKNSSDI